MSKTNSTQTVALTMGIVGMMLAGCGGGSGGAAGTTTPPTATIPATAPPTSSPTTVRTATVTQTGAETPTPSPTPTATATEPTTLTISEAVARNTNGVAVHLNETLATEGVITVTAGLFANNKLKVFAQDGGAGIMMYDETAAEIPPNTFQAGQRMRATGVILQQDPTSDNNPAIGTVLINLTNGSWSVVSDGNPLPDPPLLTLATLNATGITYTGLLVRIEAVQKVSGNWPTTGSKSTAVTISDDGGTSQATLRFQKNTITQPLAQKLSAIGSGSFTLVGIVVQDDQTGGSSRLSGFEIWARGADDIVGG